MKNFIYLLLVVFFSCNKDEAVSIPEIAKIKTLKIYNDTVLVGQVEATYNAANRVSDLRSNFVNDGGNYFIKKFIYNGDNVEINFDSEGDIGIGDFYSIKLYVNNEKLDSIFYQETFHSPFAGIEKLKFIYDDNKPLKEFGTFNNGIVYKSSEFKNVVIENGKLMTYEIFSNDSSYEKVEYAYFPDSKYNVNNFNVYNYFYTKNGALYDGDISAIPLFIYHVNFRSNTNVTALIKEEKISGYYYFNGEKISYENSVRTFNYKFDSKGRVSEMSSMMYGSDKIIIEYED